MEEAEKQNNSDGFDGKGQIVVETLSKRKSFDDQVKHAKEKDGRLLTVEEANPGFGIVGSYMSMRYGLKIVRPEAGQIIIS